MSGRSGVLAEFHTLVAADPGHPALDLIDGDGRHLAYNRRELQEQIQGSAHQLYHQGFRSGEIVPIKLPHGIVLLRALLGCLELGAIPCLLPWPFAHAGSPGDIHKLDLQLDSLESNKLITTPGMKTSWEASPRRWQGRVIEAQALYSCPPKESTFSCSPATGRQTACLQFTSGTTGAGRAIELSATAILHCLHWQKRSMGMSTRDRVLNWLPLYHDLGLFTGTLLPVLSGAKLIWISPARFLRRPTEFLNTIRQQRVTLTFATNAALHQLSQIPAGSAEPDLSSINTIICGGEPIRYDSLKRFESRYQASGYDPASWVIGYGMAETVGGVTCNDAKPRMPLRTDWVDRHALREANLAIPMASTHANAIPIVSCGTPRKKDEIRIINQAGETLGERQVGQICLRGEFLFTGYHRQPDETRKVLNSGWLLTGDLGYQVDDHLYICGRNKDLIIIGGANIHPEEIEAAVQTLTGLPPGKIVAFGIPDPATGTEEIVIAIENERHPEPPSPHFAADLRSGITEQIGFPPKHITRVSRGWIIKTSSGKISRSICQRNYLAETAHRMTDQSNEAKPL